MATHALPTADPADVIPTYVRQIVESVDPRAVILFGSYARGDATADSDVDLLVVTDFTGSPRPVARRIQAALTPRILPVDVVVVTPEQVERNRDLVGTIIRPALREGRVLYERSAA